MTAPDSDKSQLGSRATGVYSVLEGAKSATETLKEAAKNQIPAAILKYLSDVQLTTATDGTKIYFPCPFKEAEATVALKSIEACAVAAIADLRYGKKQREIEVNLERTATFLFSTYITTIGGRWKQDPEVKDKLKGKSFHARDNPILLISAL
jgi:hypothetical protein